MSTVQPSTVETVEMIGESQALIVDLLLSFKAAGATPEQLTAARLLLHRGQVFATALVATQAADSVLFDFMRVLDITAQEAAAHRPLRPLIDAAEKVTDGRPGLRIDVSLPTCYAHRPGYPEFAERLDMLPCLQSHGHDGDHKDRFGKTWTQA